MSAQLRFQTMFLLLFGQVVLGGLGWLLASRLPWAGLPVTLFLVWFIWRLGVVFGEETERRRRSRSAGVRGLALRVAIGAQLPGLLLLPYWAPAWILSLWQGALLPVVASLDLIWPGSSTAVSPWLWVVAFFEIALFTWAATPDDSQERVRAADPIPAAAGDWAPARRLADVEKRGRRVR